MSTLPKIVRQSTAITEPLRHLDGLRPLDVAEWLRDLGSVALLEDGHRSPRTGWTFLAADPIAIAQLTDPVLDPFRRARALLARMGQQPARDVDLPPWTGGLAGYLSYDLGRCFERLPDSATDDQSLPLLSLGLYDWVLAWDHRKARAWLSCRAVDGDIERMHDRRESVLARLAAASSKPVAAASPVRGDIPMQFSSNFGRDAFLTAVEHVKAEIARGEVYQVNLARRLEAAFHGDPWPLYRRISTAEPVPCGAYLELDRTTGQPRRALLSASPERFLALSANGLVATDPIKGTRPRGAMPSDDRAQRRELLTSLKDRAENVMIVDVLRNDLGRVCVPGSVRVPRLCRLERTRSVQHLVSRVVGQLRPGHDPFDLLAATFPGGSVTGAPKIRAMETINAIEPVRRGPYTGSAVWIGADGAAGSSILIRTFVADGTRLTLHVGGGMTWRSDPAAEWEETRVKARGPLDAIGASEAGPEDV
jgi:para-aminobenzoate synthetase component 1